MSTFAKPDKLLTSRRDMVAALAYWAIKQSPYTLPDSFVSVLAQFDLNLSRLWTSDPQELGFMRFTRDQLAAVLRSTLMEIPEFKDWNLSAVEKAKGVSVDDERRGSLLVTRYSEPKPECDFIDLDALIRNVCTSIERDQVK